MLRRFLIPATALAALLAPGIFGGSPASAAPHVRPARIRVCMNDDGRYIPCGHLQPTHQRASLAVSRRRVLSKGTRIVPHPAGCPRVRFCACGASLKVFGRRIKELYRAAAWFKFPRAAPGPGKVAVRQHHVFVILEAYGDGTVKAYDANSGGHLTRIHRVSLRGYRVVDPRGSRTALIR